jgi:hypothetical protein
MYWLIMIVCMHACVASSDNQSPSEAYHTTPQQQQQQQQQHMTDIEQDAVQHPSHGAGVVL